MSTVKITILYRDRRRPGSILSNTASFAFLGVLKRPASLQQPFSVLERSQALYDRSKTF